MSSRNELRADRLTCAAADRCVSSISPIAGPCLLGLVLAAGNAHLLAGALPAGPAAKAALATAWAAPENWSLLPERVAAGEWWRVFTHPFVHLSWWHLFLDAGAFVLVWTGIEGMGRPARYATALACLAGSVLAALAFDPRVATLGLCGLSGTAHGLTAVYGLSLFAAGHGLRRDAVPGHERSSLLGMAGLLCFAGVAIKSIVEARAGTVVLASWHPGSVGTPIAVVHLGGVIGGALAFAAWAAVRRFLDSLDFDLTEHPVRPHLAPKLRVWPDSGQPPRRNLVMNPRNVKIVLWTVFALLIMRPPAGAAPELEAGQAELAAVQEQWSPLIEMMSREGPRRFKAAPDALAAWANEAVDVGDRAWIASLTILKEGSAGPSGRNILPPPGTPSFRQDFAMQAEAAGVASFGSTRVTRQRWFHKAAPKRGLLQRTTAGSRCLPDSYFLEHRFADATGTWAIELEVHAPVTALERHRAEGSKGPPYPDPDAWDGLRKLVMTHSKGEAVSGLSREWGPTAVLWQAGDGVSQGIGPDTFASYLRFQIQEGQDADVLAAAAVATAWALGVDREGRDPSRNPMPPLEKVLLRDDLARASAGAVDPSRLYWSCLALAALGDARVLDRAADLAKVQGDDFAPYTAQTIAEFAALSGSPLREFTDRPPEGDTGADWRAWFLDRAKRTK